MAGDDFDLVAHIQDLQRNSESGLALVTVALVDEWLEKLLLTAMRELSNTVATRLFETGPLQSFAAKADIAFAFRLIDAELLAVLRILRDVRNRFAHTRVSIGFQSPDIDALCQKLPGWKPSEDNERLFNVVAFDCVRTIDAKTEELIFESATDVKNDG